MKRLQAVLGPTRGELEAREELEGRDPGGTAWQQTRKPHAGVTGCHGWGLWGGREHLVMPPPDIQDVSLGDRPVEGQARHGVAKGERVLVVGDPGDIDGHLRGEARPVTTHIPWPEPPDTLRHSLHSPPGPAATLSPEGKRGASIKSSRIGGRHSTVPAPPCPAFQGRGTPFLNDRLEL